MELEKVHKELYPFRERNLPRVEDSSGKRIELPAAWLAFPDCKAGLLVESVSSNFLRSTERAFLDDDGIYEIHFFFRWLPMFGVIPFRDGRDYQVTRLKSIGKLAPEGFFCLLFMFGSSALWRAFSRNRQVLRRTTLAKRLSQ